MSMTLAQAHQQIETMVDGLALGVPVLFENVGDYNLADLPSNIYDGDSDFIIFAVEIADSRRLELNPNPASEESGYITFDIYLRKGYGVRNLYNLLDSVDSVFKHKTVNGVNFRDRVKVTDINFGKWVIYSYQYHFVFCN